jgi:hypothetical protein
METLTSRLFSEAIDSYFSNPANKFPLTYPGELINEDSESASVGEGIALTRRGYPPLHGPLQDDTTAHDLELQNSTQALQDKHATSSTSYDREHGRGAYSRTPGKQARSRRCGDKIKNLKLQLRHVPRLGPYSLYILLI